jgi:hypothetical protein
MIFIDYKLLLLSRVMIIEDLGILICKEKQSSDIPDRCGEAEL